MEARRFILSLGLIWTALFAVSMAFERPEFRPWELLYDAETYRFRPNRRISLKSVGDLGYSAWVKALQIEREVTFSTDAWGLRNPPGIETPRIVVLGDSYLVGSGSSDSEILTARMTAQLREPVYNFGVQSIDSPALFLRDPRFSRTPPQIVIWTPVARRIRPRPLSIPHRDEAKTLLSAMSAAYLAVDDALADLATRADRDNGLAYQARFLYNGLLYRLVGHERLIYPDGRPALALDVAAQGLAVSPQGRDVGTTIEMVHAFSKFLADHGIDFVYCPLPESATIYPELFPDRGRIVAPSFLDVLIQELRRRGVNVVDLRPHFRENKKPYLYLRDDSHWNPRAIALAAEALAMQVRVLDAAREPMEQVAGTP